MQLRKRSAGSRHDYGSTKLRPAALRAAALWAAALWAAALWAAALWATALRATALRAATLRAAVPIIGAGYRWRVPSYSHSPPQRRPGRALSLQLYRARSESRDSALFAGRAHTGHWCASRRCPQRRVRTPSDEKRGHARSGDRCIAGILAHFSAEIPT